MTVAAISANRRSADIASGEAIDGGLIRFAKLSLYRFCLKSRAASSEEHEHAERARQHRARRGTAISRRGGRAAAGIGLQGVTAFRRKSVPGNARGLAGGGFAIRRVDGADRFDVVRLERAKARVA